MSTAELRAELARLAAEAAACRTRLSEIRRGLSSCGARVPGGVTSRRAGEQATASAAEPEAGPSAAASPTHELPG